MENKKALYYVVVKDDEFITVDDIKEAAVEAREDYKTGKLKKYKSTKEMFIDNNWTYDIYDYII
jgi:hypothetical protein